MSFVRVLHVDDEADIREVVEISLGIDPGILAICCASGQEALATAATWYPDIILLDVMMPAMDGPATLKRLRDNPETVNIPVVFMTARAQSREIDSFRSLGAVGVIPKPFDPMKLAALVRTHLQSTDTRLGELRNEFLLRFDRDIIALSGHWSALTVSMMPDALEGMRHVAHGLAGTGGLFGFNKISDAAARLEEAVILKRDGFGTQEDVHCALDHLKACARKNDGGKTTHRANT
jgi:CheY-like chemotaxis protein